MRTPASVLRFDATFRGLHGLPVRSTKADAVAMSLQSVAEAAALRAWREAERELVKGGDGRADLEANVARTRDRYQHLYTDDMSDNLARLQEADQRRARAVPSTPEFHAAARDTEAIAAEIWGQAERADLDGPQGQEARSNR